MRKALSLLLVLAMVVCFAVPAMAASPEGATVTVYITRDMFTKGGIDSNGNQIPQAYIGGVPTSYVKKVEVEPSKITASELAQYRNSYSNPDTTSTTVNVLDAIACALTRATLPILVDGILTTLLTVVILAPFPDLVANPQVQG